MTLPEGDVKQWDVVGWGFAQARHLKPSRHHVLLFLICHAYYRERNPQRAIPGTVMPDHVTYEAIRRGTGLSRSTIYDSLQDLFHNGYLYLDMVPSDLRENKIRVLWDEVWDRIREDARTGIKPLPKSFQKPAREFVAQIREEANISDLNAHRRQRAVRPTVG